MKNITIRKYNTLEVSGNFQIIELDRLLAYQVMVEKIHRHDFYYMLIIKSGSGSHNLDFNLYTIQKYSLFLLKPGQVHELTLNKGGSGFIITFDKQFYYPDKDEITKAFRSLFQKDYYQLEPGLFDEIFQILNHILDENTNKPFGYRNAIATYFDLFFLKLIRKKQRSINKKNSVDYELLEQFSFLLEQKYKSNKTAKFYADKLNITPHRLNSITKNILGKTSTQIIADQLILEAKRNLLATTLQINEIAFLLGFEDDSYFIRFFKKHTNTTPKVFREQY